MSTQQQSNHLCQQIGHLWDAPTTVIKDYRRCTRQGCHTAQRLVRGSWRAVPTKRTRSQAKQQAVQPALFAPDRAFPDHHEIHRAERAYRDLLQY